MTSPRETRWNRDQLLCVESICDHYEDELAQGSAQDQEFYCRELSGELREWALEELNRIHQAWHFQLEQPSNGETLDDQNLPTVAVTPQSHPVVTSETPTDASGQRLGKYRLTERLGHGSSGTVWRAYDTILRRWVALKLTRCATLREASRFTRETVAATRLEHPQIVRVFDAGRIGNQFFIASQLIEGSTLADYLKRQPPSLERSIELIIQLAAAVDHAHQNGIIHRDLKPQNVMVDTNGNAYVTDFDLARHLHQEHSLTCSGDMIGTPAYMSPEQVQGESRNCDPRSDLYSLGVILYQMLTGRLPFQGRMEQILDQVIRTPATPAHQINPQIPRSLSVLCQRCLAKDPSDRLSGVPELMDELRRFQQGQPLTIRPFSSRQMFRQWIRRDPKTAALGSVLFALLIFSGAMISWHWRWQYLANTRQRQLTQSREEFEARIIETEEKLIRTQKLNERLTSLLPRAFSPADLADTDPSPADQPERVAAWDRNALQEFESAIVACVSPGEGRTPVVQALADQYRRQGLDSEAERLLQSYKNGQIISPSTDRPTPPDLQARFWLLAGHMSFDRGDYQTALEQLETAARSLQPTASRTHNAEYDLLMAQIAFGKACAHMAMQKAKTAQPLLERACELRCLHLETDDPLRVATERVTLKARSTNGPPDSTSQMLEQLPDDGIVSAIEMYGQIQQHRSDKEWEIAIARYRKLLEHIESQVGRQENLYLLASGDFAGLLLDAGRYAEAEPLIQQMRESTELFSADHPQRLAVMLRYGEELVLARRFAEAFNWLEQIQTVLDPSSTSFDSLEYSRQSAMTECLWELKRFPEARVYSQTLLDNQTEICDQRHAWHLFLHGRILDAMNDQQAETFLQQSLDTIKKLQADRGFTNDLLGRSRIGEILLYLDRPDQAASHLETALDLARQEYPEQHPRLARQLELLAKVTPDREQAQQLRDRAQAILRSSLPAIDTRLD